MKQITSRGAKGGNRDRFLTSRPRTRPYELATSMRLPDEACNAIIKQSLSAGDLTTGLSLPGSRWGDYETRKPARSAPRTPFQPPASPIIEGIVTIWITVVSSVSSAIMRVLGELSTGWLFGLGSLSWS